MALFNLQNKSELDINNALELAINVGSNDCVTLDNYHEFIYKKSDFYKVKNRLRKNVKTLIYSGVEWRAHNNIDLI